MSCYEWERGEFKLPSKEFSKFRRSLVEWYNARQKRLLQKALEVYASLAASKTTFNAEDAVEKRLRERRCIGYFGSYVEADIEGAQEIKNSLLTPAWVKEDSGQVTPRERKLKKPLAKDFPELKLSADLRPGRRRQSFKALRGCFQRNEAKTMSEKEVRIIPILSGEDDFWLVLDGPQKLTVLGAFYADQTRREDVIAVACNALTHLGYEPIEREPQDWTCLLNAVVMPADVDDDRWEAFLRYTELGCETPFLNWVAENCADAFNMGSSEEAQSRFIQERCESVIRKEKD